MKAAGRKRKERGTTRMRPEKSEKNEKRRRELREKKTQKKQVRG